jgi:hypothetical protein
MLEQVSQRTLTVLKRAGAIAISVALLLSAGGCDTSTARSAERPVIAGAAEVGEVLSSKDVAGDAHGTITRRASASYRWERCRPPAGRCTPIHGATSSTYTVLPSDLHSTLRVLLETNGRSLTSAQTPPVAASSAHRRGCIHRPSACGYPDATNSGVPPGVKLKSKSGTMHVTGAGSTIKDIRLDGTISVEADNTTIEDSEIIVNGSESCSSHPCGGHGILIEGGVSGTVIEHTTIRGGASSGADVVQSDVKNEGEDTQLSYDYLYNATEPLNGDGQISNSFIDANGAIPEEHYEDIYYGGGAGPLIADHDTMLNPHPQTAVVFASVDFGNQTMLSITNNLMAGGGYVLYGGGSGESGEVLGPVTVTGNRFSRLYFREGGFYGLDAHFNDAVTVWSKNIWDETRRSARK